MAGYRRWTWPFRGRRGQSPTTRCQGASGFQKAEPRGAPGGNRGPQKGNPELQTRTGLVTAEVYPYRSLRGPPTDHDPRVRKSARAPTSTGLRVGHGASGARANFCARTSWCIGDPRRLLHAWVMVRRGPRRLLYAYVMARRGPAPTSVRVHVTRREPTHAGPRVQGGRSEACDGDRTSRLGPVGSRRGVSTAGGAF
jgi:hypothetical protein